MERIFGPARIQVFGASPATMDMAEKIVRREKVAGKPFASIKFNASSPVEERRLADELADRCGDLVDALPALPAKK